MQQVMFIHPGIKSIILNLNRLAGENNAFRFKLAAATPATVAKIHCNLGCDLVKTTYFFILSLLEIGKRLHFQQTSIIVFSASPQSDVLSKSK